MIDHETLLQPVSDDAPAGPDLSYDPGREAIEQAFASPAEEVDWDATIAAIVAVVVGASLTLARVVKGQTLQFALSGLFGIALAGFIVSKTGNASDFFLPGILINIGYAAAYFVSIVVRWPIMGVIIGSLSGEPTAWRKDPLLSRTYTRVTWIWVGLFLLRLSVQLPLYLADALVALGVARVAMGIPLFVLGLWLTYLIVQRATPQSAAPPATA